MRLILCLTALILPATLSAQQVERVALQGRDVAVYNLAGTLRVEGRTGDQVVVEVTRRGREGGRLTLATGQVRGRTTLSVRYPSDRITYDVEGWHGRTTFTVRENGTFGGYDTRFDDQRRVEIDSRGGGLEAHADLRVLVPRGMTVSLYQGVGATTVDNVDGTISVEVGAMGVRASRVRGSLAVESGSGGVQISDMTGSLNVESGSGGVTINGSRGGALHLEIGSGGLRGSSIDASELEVEVGSGGVQLTKVRTNKVRLETGSGGSDVELLSETVDASVENGSGGVTLRMPASTSADVDIEAESGSIQSDFEVRSGRVGRGTLRGSIGSGAGRLRIESGSGTVRLLRT